MESPGFQQLVDAHYAPLYRFALSLTKSSDDACDLTQQTFYIWATRGNSLRDKSKAKTWLFTTLYREFLRIRRRGSRMSSIEDLPPSAQDPVDLNNDDMSQLDYQIVFQALQDIDENFRAPLSLFYLKDMSYQEISEILEIPIGTVMSRLSRGKNHLRAAIAKRLQGAKVVEFPNANSG